MTAITRGYSDETIEGTEDFIEVVSVDTGGGYDWHTLAAWYSPKADRFYWIAGSGCSCNYFMEDTRTLSDFQDGDRDALVRAIDNEYDYDRGSANVSEALQTVKTWQVPA